MRHLWPVTSSYSRSLVAAAPRDDNQYRPVSQMLEATSYEMAARMLFGPFGGLGRVRHQVLDAFPLLDEPRVLELGCGPGGLTRQLVARGARVHAVDSSRPMLAAARRAVPGASFEEADVRTYAPEGRFQVVLLSFILHELPAAELPDILGRLSAALAPGGRLVIVDHTLPPGAAGRVWRAVLRLVESGTIDDWLALDLRATLAAQGLVATEDRRLASGRVRVAIAERGSRIVDRR